ADEQRRGWGARIRDPRAEGKLSPRDREAGRGWYESSRARDAMFRATDPRKAPWSLVHSDDKKRARLNVLAHVLDQIPYKKVKREKVKLPEAADKGAYDDLASLKGRRWLKARY